MRPQDPLDYEKRFWGRSLFRVAGVDEAGRGPLAGPVVAAAVILPVDGFVEGVGDSKALSAARREALFPQILERASAVGIGAASVREIERLNILRATTLAFARALHTLALSGPLDHVVVDGLPVRGLEREHVAVVGGDALIHSIGCASIVAKVVRDRLMVRLARRYPAYGWERNMGYGTAAHLAALREQGPSPHHRRTFGGVQVELPL